MELTNPLFLFSLSDKLLSNKRLENPGNLCLSTQGSWFKEDLQAAGELEATPSPLGLQLFICLGFPSFLGTSSLFSPICQLNFFCFCS